MPHNTKLRPSVKIVITHNFLPKINRARGNTKIPSSGKKQWIYLYTGPPPFRLKYVHLIRIKCQQTDVAEKFQQADVAELCVLLHRINYIIQSNNFQNISSFLIGVLKSSEEFFRFWKFFSSGRLLQSLASQNFTRNVKKTIPQVKMNTVFDSSLCG